MKRVTNELIQQPYFHWILYVRDSGVYYAGRSEIHGRERISLGTKDLEEALANLQELDAVKACDSGLISEQELRSGEQNPSIQEGWKWFMEYCDRGQVQGGVSPGTLKRYRAVRTHHEKFCAQEKINGWAGFDKQAFQLYGRMREAKAAYRTVYLELTTIKGVAGWLIQEGHLPESCRIRMKLPKPQGTDTYCYSSEEISAMVDYCLKSDELKWLGDVIVALAHTGMRIGELVALRWSDVDLENGHIRVADERFSRRRQQLGNTRKTKGRRSRVIPIHSRLDEVLRSLPGTAEGPVFRAKKGGALRPKVVRDILVREVIEPLKAHFPTPPGEIGFTDGRIHSFRHTFCSQCFLGGASEGEIRQWLGHADSKMVEHYRHLRTEEARNRMNTLNFMDGSAVLPSD